MTEIRFEKVKKNFKDTVVIKALDLKIPAGEFFTFVGPSGCGKSTILNMLAGLESITAGTIYFDNAAINALSPRERDVAMVFQSYALYPHMTVYENIAFPLRMKRGRQQHIAGAVQQVAALLGLENILQRRPKELSGGQKQRVALGRAIIRRPRVFLMDEPLSNLDARLRVEMRAEIKRLHRKFNITTVYVSHDQAEAMSLSERIAVLHQGVIQQCGTPLEVYLRPANTFVAGFIGSQPMNFIPASVAETVPVSIDCNGMRFSPVLENVPPTRSLIAGIRPEDILISPEKVTNAQEVTVQMMEPAGSVNWVDCAWTGQMVRGHAALHKDLRVGDRAFMVLSPDKVLLFDAASSERLA
jgi:multiple sugar transport system ATP-binding protein